MLGVNFWGSQRLSLVAVALRPLEFCKVSGRTFSGTLCLGNLSPECIAPDGAPPWLGSAGVRTLRNELFLFSCPLCHLW